MHAIEIQEWLDQNRGQPRTDGITAVDLLDLPAILNHIMRLLFAQAPMSESQLRAAVAEAPEALRLEAEELHQALSALGDQRWLVRIDAPDGGSEPVYKINFRAKNRDTGASRRWHVLDFES